MPKTQEWIKEQLARESFSYWTEMKLTEEVKKLQERVTELERKVKEYARDD